MNHQVPSLSSSRKLLVTASGLLLAGLLTAAAVAETAPSSKAVLKLDEKPIATTTLEPASFSKVAKKIAPSVVTITTERKARVSNQRIAGMDDPFFRQFFGGRIPQMQQPAQTGLGSGVIVSADGYIITNNHVVEGADSVLVTLDDQKELKARIIGRDPLTDIAVIKVDGKELPAITFTTSSKVEVGDRVLAIGNPFGIGETVTSGIVSAKGRRPGLGLAYEDFIQTDAAINPGNSGGALVDIEGRLIGINTAILSRSGGFQGVGLAVPSDLVRHVVDSIVKNGKVVRGFLGVTVRDLSSDIAETYNLKPGTGALIFDVTPDSAADKAGLRSDDVITHINGKPVTTGNDVSLIIGQTAPGTKVEITILRDGASQKIEATVGTHSGRINKNKRFADEDEGQSLSVDGDNGVLNGVGVTDLDEKVRRNRNIPDRIQGALITDVEPDSASARAGIKPGDIILEINSKSVKNAEDAVKLSEEATSKKTRVKLWSRGAIILVVVDETEK